MPSHAGDCLSDPFCQLNVPKSSRRGVRRMKEGTSIGPLGNKAKNGTLAIIGINRFSTLVNKVSQDEE